MMRPKMHKKTVSGYLFQTRQDQIINSEREWASVGRVDDGLLASEGHLVALS